MNITMFPMGFGESILIHEGDSCLLVDCGSESKSKDDYFDNIVWELKKYQKRSLLISHFHEDHINGVKYLYDYYPQGFDMVYLPNIFEKGNAALELLILQYLKDLGTKKSESYQIWQLFFDLIKSQNQIKFIQRGDDFDGLVCQFKTLWPIKYNKKVVALWSDIQAVANNIGFPLQQITFIADRMRSAVQWITGVEDVNERYSRAEEIVDISFECFLDLHTCKTEAFCSNDDESRQIKKQIQTLLKKVKKNEHSIVFHTADEYHLQVLMTGDVATDSMDEIAKNLATPSVPIKDCYHVFKAPHHGTSTHYCNILSYDRLLISNGEIKGSEAKRGKISERYLSGNSVKHCILHKSYS